MKNKFNKYITPKVRKVVNIVELVCPGCDTRFPVREEVADRGRKYCSMNCYGLVSGKNITRNLQK